MAAMATDSPAATETHPKPDLQSQDARADPDSLPDPTSDPHFNPQSQPNDSPPQPPTKPSTADLSTEQPQTPPQPTKPASKPSQPAEPGVFSAWGFDVNAVANNINIAGLFSTPDPEARTSSDVEEASDTDAEADDKPNRDEQHHERESHGFAPSSDPAEELSQAAASIATAASTEIEHASKAAQETFGKAAEELGRGWGTFNTFLDDILTPKVDGVDSHPPADMTAAFHTLFPGLDLEDQVVDTFQCALLQKYRCYLNNITPEKAFALRGRLFITTSHIAMHISDDTGVFGREPFGFTVPFSDVGKIQKGAMAMLKLVTKTQKSYIFADFESDSHFSGALGLLEHMAASGSTAAPAAPAASSNTPPTPSSDNEANATEDTSITD